MSRSLLRWVFVIGQLKIFVVAAVLSWMLFGAIGPLLPFLLTAGYSLTMLYLFGKKVSDWPSREDITSICYRSFFAFWGVGSTIYVLMSVFLPETTGSEFPKTALLGPLLWAGISFGVVIITRIMGDTAQSLLGHKAKNEEVTSFRDYPW